MVPLLFKFFKNLHSIFYSGCTSLHSHQQCSNIPFSPHPFQHLVFQVILRNVCLGLLPIFFYSKKCEVIPRVFIFISLITSGVEHPLFFNGKAFYFKYSSVYISIPNYQFITTPQLAHSLLW